MYKLKTTKQLKYFDEVIQLHYEEGYGEDRIASVLPVGHTIVSRWISIFASQHGDVPHHSGKEDMRKGRKNDQSILYLKKLTSNRMKSDLEKSYIICDRHWVME